jgi:hypothetical protein
MTYVITVNRTGGAAQNVVLKDVLPAGVNFVSAKQLSGAPFALLAPPVGTTGTVTITSPSLVAGGSASFSIVVRVTGPSGTALINDVQISSTPDAQAGNNRVTTSLAITAP